MFEQNSAPAHRAYKMVGRVSGSIDTWLQPACCLVLKRWTFFHQRTRLSSLSELDSNWRTSWGKQACAHDILWRQRYITTSKEYLTNCHILLIYFELVFLQLQLLNILCKLIDIWVRYERKKTGSIFMKHCVHIRFNPLPPPANFSQFKHWFKFVKRLKQGARLWQTCRLQTDNVYE